MLSKARNDKVRFDRQESPAIESKSAWNRNFLLSKQEKPWTGTVHKWQQTLCGSRWRHCEKLFRQFESQHDTLDTKSNNFFEDFATERFLRHFKNQFVTQQPLDERHLWTTPATQTHHSRSVNEKIDILLVTMTEHLASQPQISLRQTFHAPMIQRVLLRQTRFVSVHCVAGVDIEFVVAMRRHAHILFVRSHRTVNPLSRRQFVIWRVDNIDERHGHGGLGAPFGLTIGFEQSFARFTESLVFVVGFGTVLGHVVSGHFADPKFVGTGAVVVLQGRLSQLKLKGRGFKI